MCYCYKAIKHVLYLVSSDKPIMIVCGSTFALYTTAVMTISVTQQYSLNNCCHDNI